METTSESQSEKSRPSQVTLPEGSSATEGTGEKAAKESAAEAKASRSDAKTKKMSSRSPKKSSRESAPEAVVAALETQVRAAVEEIAKLRRTNAELRNEIADLAAVARRQQEASSTAEAQSVDEAAGEEWEAERSRIRERVEGLVEGLERLLAVAEEE